MLLSLVDDILDFSKIEAGEVLIESIDFDLRDVVRDAAAIFEERAREKGLGLDGSVGRDVPVYLTGDPFRIRQILTNLLSNAIKFTEEGEVVLKVGHAETSGDSVTIRFEVTDTGIGMDEEQRARLFRPFSQADPSTTRRYGGTGLGLAISGQLVDLLGGEMSVKSEPGIGSSFSFTVPLEKQKVREQGATLVKTLEQSPELPPPMNRKGVEEPEAGRSGACVLVVEDTLTNQMVAVELLERRGYAADVVFNGAQALDVLSRVPYAAVLMDLQMPEMDGYEATAEIRRREGTGRRTPIIAMTAHALQGDREKALAAGMDDHLSKPIRPEELDRVLKKWVAPSAEPPGAPPQAAERPPGSDGSLDLTVLESLRLIQQEGGGDIVDRLVATFLEEVPSRLAALHADAERDDPQAFWRAAHALNGTCRSVGAARMGDICMQLERLGDSGDLTAAPGLFAQLEEEFGRVRLLLDAELPEG
jgi:CheY-like chemotaxis protein/HPt (histidine-containing phosphotransfer) domain-containing protein